MLGGLVRRATARLSHTLVLLLATLLLLVVSGWLRPTPAHAAPAVPSHPAGVPVLLAGPWQSGPWMCERWEDAGWFYTHCTQHWYVSGGHLYSLNTSWVPNFHGAPGQPAATMTTSSSGDHEPDGDGDDGVPAGGSSGGSTGSVAWRGGSPNDYPWGWCTWGAAHLAYDNVDWLGNAKDWLYNAQRRGLPTGTVPRLNATVVFQPGVDGASPLGHVAHVVRVYPDGSFDSESMAQPIFGVFTITHHVMQWGIAFIY